MSKLTSFIIPAFNSGKTMQACLDSILKQKGGKEIIAVVDPRSKDETIEICRKTKGVETLVDVGKSRGSARNAGLRKAKGELIAFIDSDVVLPLDWLEKAKELLEKEEKIAGVGGPGLSVDKSPVSNALDKLLFGKISTEKSSHVEGLATMDALFKKSAVDGIFFDESFETAEDPEFCFQVREKCFKLLYSNELFVYHHHPTTLRGLLKKWFVYGYNYTLPFKKHPQFRNKAYYARVFFIPIMLAAIIASFFNPIFLAIPLFQILLLLLAYVFIGLRAGGDFFFPTIHSLKQFMQLIGVFLGVLKRGF